MWIPTAYAHLIFQKVSLNIQWRKDSLFNKHCWENWVSACRKLKLDPCLSPKSTNSKWIKDFNLRPEPLKLVQEIAWNTVEFTGIGSIFLNRTPMAQQRRERIVKWGNMKLKCFCTRKEIVARLRRLTSVLKHYSGYNTYIHGNVMMKLPV
jgi:hypothetical protein